MSEEECKPEKANVHMIKVINGYETQVINIVDYSDNVEDMILDATLMESHNYTDEDTNEVLKILKQNDFNNFEDNWDITLVVIRIEPFTEKQLDKDIFLTIKYPAI